MSTQSPPNQHAATHLSGGSDPVAGLITLDTTAADIQPVGTQAAGANGLGSDSGHVHAMTVLSGVIGGDVTASSTGVTKIFDTSSLAVGVWLVSMSGVFEFSGAGGVAYDVEALVDTATATFSGPRSGYGETNAAIAASVIAFTFVATVTVAGTLQFQINNNGGAHPVIVKASTPGSGAYANATGWTALRIG